MRFFVLLFFLLVSFFQINFVLASDKFDQANEAYSKGKYREAIQLYKQIITENGQSASVYFNLANSYAQLGENGRAILNYQRGLHLEPGNSDIIKNYEFFKKETGLYIDEQPTFKKFIYTLTINQWSGLSLFFLFGFTLTVVFWKRISAGSLVRGIANGLLFFILTGIGTFATAILYNDWQKQVIIKDTKILLSPFESSQSKGIIKAGRLVLVDKEYKNYIHIKTETGQQGWMKKDNLEAVLPN